MTKLIRPAMIFHGDPVESQVLSDMLTADGFKNDLDIKRNAHKEEYGVLSIEVTDLAEASSKTLMRFHVCRTLSMNLLSAFLNVERDVRVIRPDMMKWVKTMFFNTLKGKSFQHMDIPATMNAITNAFMTLCGELVAFSIIETNPDGIDTVDVIVGTGDVDVVREAAKAKMAAKVVSFLRHTYGSDVLPSTVMEALKYNKDNDTFHWMDDLEGKSTEFVMIPADNVVPAGK